ncbi:MAG: alanine--tRNA ligase-related protein, partial [Halobacteriales archaeon]|nr:alanine--tRNA ligase-related protein [Halobacteriales archaeon]
MTGSRASADPETTDFETTIVSVEGHEVTLQETYFYPEGGGQPADRGTIGGVLVSDVQTIDGDVVHTLEEAPAFEEGDTVVGAVDPAFRRYCMRSHTASHVLYGAGRRLLEDLGYGGFGITDEKVRVDFTTSTDVDDETLVELERLVNRTVWDSRAVSWETLPKEEALGKDEIAFNTKTEEGIAGDSVRVVTVEDWDIAACGGTHVRNTREIGPVTVLSRSNPGEGLTRVEIAVGPPGIGRRSEEKRALLAASRAAGTGPTDLPAEITRLREETERLEAQVTDLEAAMASAKVEELRDDVVETDGAEWLV